MAIETQDNEGNDSQPVPARAIAWRELAAEKAGLLKARTADPQAKVSRQFIVVLIVQVTLVVIVFLIAVVWQNSLNDERSTRSRIAACQFDYSVQLSHVLQARAAVSERLRLAGAAPEQVNAALNAHPYPKVPDCR